MSANIKASTDGTQAIIGVGGVDQMTVSNAGVVTANSFVGAISGNASSATALATGSTTARTLANRFADVVNVRDFGAVGDGVADDTAAIQAALAVQTATNKLIFLPEGTYKYTAGYIIGMRGFGPGRILNTVKPTPMGAFFPAGVVANADEYAHLSQGGFLVGGQGESQEGTTWKSAYNPAWSGISPSFEGSVIEFGISPRGVFTPAVTVSGTGNINLIIYYPPSPYVTVGDIIGFGDSYYKISNIVKTGLNITQITVTTLSGSPVTFGSSYTEIFRWAALFNKVKVNISGNTLTRVGGDPFILNGSLANQRIFKNDIAYTVSSFVSTEQVITTSPIGDATNVWVIQKNENTYMNIFRQQGLYGPNEENLAHWGELDGSWSIGPQYAGLGKYRKLRIGYGSNADSGTDIRPIVTHPNTCVSIGNGAESAPVTGQGPFAIERNVPNAQGGTTYFELFRAKTFFNNTDPRMITIGFKNNYQGAIIQSHNDQLGAGGGSTYIQPDDGPTYIGVPTTFTSASGRNIVLGGDTYPNVNNSLYLGTTALRWAGIWVNGGLITTSDEREKTDIKESELGLSFIKNLKPVSYKWKEGKNETYKEEIEEEIIVPVTIKENKAEIVTEIVDGKAIQKEIIKEVEIPVYDEIPIFAENGDPVIGKNGEQAKQRIQKTEKKIVKKTIEKNKSISGKRTHFGLIAQEVKAALPEGVDFGGWVLTDLEDSNSEQALRYEEFISPLIKAIQEQQKQIEELSAKVLALESK
jgi:hypothetical protein